MASSATPSTFQSLAAQAQAAHNRRDSERLFFEALEDARAEASSENDTKLLQKLASIDDKALLKNTVKHELQSRLGRKFVKFSESLNRAAEIALILSECNSTIAKPIVGVVCYVMTILQELPDTQDLIKKFKKRMMTYLTQFNEHFLDKHALGPSLEDSLKSVHRVIINFGLTVIPLGQKSRINLHLGLWTHNTKSELVNLVQELKEAADNVYQNAGGEDYKGRIALINALAAPQAPNPSTAQPQTSNLSSTHAQASNASSPQPPSTPTAGTTRCPAIPMAQTPHFTGRQAQLYNIRRQLGNFRNDDPGAVALWGMGGVGKTQTPLFYSKHTFHPTSAVPMYPYVLFLQANDQNTLFAEVRRNLLGLGIANEALLQTPDTRLIVERFMAWLQITEGWILIFDNVQNINDIHPFRPGRGRGHIIFTTRDKALAELLCPREKAIELFPLTAQEGIQLVRSIMDTDLSQTPDNDDTARQVSDFALGLPLMIEQVAMYAKFARQSLSQSLETMKNKRALLSAKAFASFHPGNLTMGAILITSFEAVAAKYPMAGALFQYLCHLEPSSIPMSLLTRGARDMDRYLSRPTTYDRGAVRSPEAEAHYQQRSQPQRFNLYDYNPWQLTLYKRMLHIGKFSKKSLRPSLPRIDSTSDIEMQRYWQSDAKLKGVFDDEHQLNKALTQLESAFLIRLLPKRNAIWIHDLFAELMMAYINEYESQERSMVKAHTAATLVWLAFPITQNKLVAWDKRSEYLLHAQSCLRHMKEHGTLLMDANVGAELSHVVASRIWDRGGGRFACDGEELRRADYEMSVEYYQDALKGYLAARKRFVAHSGFRGWKGMKRISDVTKSEMEDEIERQKMGKGPISYSPGRWMWERERFGSSAAWRYLQTLGAVGIVMDDLERYDEAVWYLRQAKKGTELLLRDSDIGVEEVMSISGLLMRTLKKKRDWEGALELAKEQLVVVGKGGYLQVAGQATVIGEILIKLGRGDEGLDCLKYALRQARGHYGWHGYDTFGWIEALVAGYEELGHWEASLDCWLDAMGTLLLNDVAYDVWRVERWVTGYENARSKCEDNAGIPETLKEQIEVADRAVVFWKEAARNHREMEKLDLELLGYEMTDEMKEMLRIGKEKEWI